MNKFGDWYNWYSTFNWTLHQWLTKAWKQDGYVSDFAWHWVCWRLRYIWGKKLEIMIIKFYKIIKILRAPWLVKKQSLIAPINPWEINCFLSEVDECSKWTDAIRSFKLIPSKWTDAIQIHLALIPRAHHTTVLAILCKLGMVLNVKVSLVFHEGDEIYILFPTFNVAVNWLRADFHYTWL